MRVNAHTFFIAQLFFVRSDDIRWETREKTVCVCVHYSKIRDEETDIRKKWVGSFSRFFLCFSWTLYLGHTKKDRRWRPTRKYEAASTENRTERQKMDIEICARREVFISPSLLLLLLSTKRHILIRVC